MKSSISSENKKLGFTLVELIVVMAIASIMMTTLVIQQNQWNDSLIVSTQAYEMTLMIRQAQIYSLGVREDTAGSRDKFNIGYGVYFDVSTPDRYTFFADRNANQNYDSGEEVETKTLTRGVTIDRICGIHQGSNDVKCSMGFQQLDEINISFFRPEPKANINFLRDNVNGGKDIVPLNPPVMIYLKSSGNKQYVVTVEISGEISVAPVTP